MSLHPSFSQSSRATKGKISYNTLALPMRSCAPSPLCMGHDMLPERSTRKINSPDEVMDDITDVGNSG